MGEGGREGKEGTGEGEEGTGGKEEGTGKWNRGRGGEGRRWEWLPPLEWRSGYAPGGYWVK